MQLSDLQKNILRLYAYRHWSEKTELLMSEEVAKQLELSKDLINDELEKLEVIGLLGVKKAFGGHYSAVITPEGLIVIDEIGPISDKD